MKKLFALTLALCLMLCSAALANELVWAGEVEEAASQIDGEFQTFDEIAVKIWIPAVLEAVKKGQVYGCNVTTSMFYEETPFRPDLLLQDFIQILHPDIPNLPPLRYYHKVE